jgi:hypothetical protein
MSNLGALYEKLLVSATRHPEGDKYLVQPDPLGLAKDRFHVFQFDVEGGEPFYLTLNKRDIKATAGVSSLDRRSTADWNKITNIWTDAETLKAVIHGDKNLIAEWHGGKWDFTSRNSNSPYQSWFCIVMRLAREQLERELVKAYLTKEMEKGLGPALETLLKKIKGHPEGAVLLTEPPVVKNSYKVDVCEHTFQFELEDGKPFYLYMGKGDVAAKDGVSSLDRRGKDWNKISLIWTYTDTLKGVIYGEKNLIAEWHEGRWDFSARNSNSPYHSWFCIVMRMAREQLAKELVREYLS